MRSRAACPSLILFVFLAFVACGGGAEPAKSAESPADVADANGTAPEAANPSSDNESTAKSQKKDDAAAAPSAESDVSAILQLVVDDPELDNYLHLGQPGRFPLQISGQKLPSGLKLTKSTEPVKVVDAPKSKKDAVLVITELDIGGDKASVRYRYDVEGIRATVTLARGAHGWELKNSRLVEH